MQTIIPMIEGKSMTQHQSGLQSASQRSWDTLLPEPVHVVRYFKTPKRFSMHPSLLEWLYSNRSKTNYSVKKKQLTFKETARDSMTRTHWPAMDNPYAYCSSGVVLHCKDIHQTCQTKVFKKRSRLSLSDFAGSVEQARWLKSVQIRKGWKKDGCSVYQYGVFVSPALLEAQCLPHYVNHAFRQPSCHLKIHMQKTTWCWLPLGPWFAAQRKGNNTVISLRTPRQKAQLKDWQHSHAKDSMQCWT